jgi:hypothetical protein
VAPEEDLVGRHANPVPEDVDLVRRSPLAAWSARVAIGMALVLAFAGGIGLSFLDPAKVVDLLPGENSQGTCPSVPVSVVVAPELDSVVTSVLTPLQRRRVDGGCLSVDVRAQEPSQTIASAGVLPRDRMPQLWIPDSSLWLLRAGDLPVTPLGSVATSPVVVVASPADAKKLDDAGTWAETLDGSRSLALLHPDTSAVGLLALSAVAGTAGAQPGPALAALLHAVKFDGSSTAMAAMESLRVSGSQGAEIAVVAEQTVLGAQAGWKKADFVPVYPDPGSPTLDYPLTKINGALWSAGQQAGANLIAQTLSGTAGSEALRSAGFRSPKGTISETDPVQVPAKVKPLPAPSPKDLAAIAKLLTELAPPTRMLAVLDISTSMRAPVESGQTRVDLVRDVVKVAAASLTDDARVGLWLFASELDGKKDYKEVAPIRRLDADVHAGTTQRQLMVSAAQRLPDQLVTGGTSLYDTAFAAVSEMVRTYDPEASNVVVMITDGVNEDSTGLKLPQVKAKLRALTKDKPVRLIAIAVGPDTDMKSLSALAGATVRGKAYKVMHAQELQQVLFDALSSR